MQPFTIDFETTGRDASTAYPIEVGIACPDDGAYEWETLIALPPGRTIPVESMAVHHIVDEDLEGAPYWPEVLVAMRRQLECDDSLDQLVLVAHNADYEKTILMPTEFRDREYAQEGFPGVPWICTYKCALVVWPDAPAHSNEGLRYWLGRQHPGKWLLGRQYGSKAHSALFDAKVTAGIFNHLLEVLMDNGLSREEVIQWMIDASKLPAQLPTCPIGKERGKKWEEVDGGFLGWCTRQPDMREDVVFCAKRELERRARVRVRSQGYR